MDGDRSLRRRLNDTVGKIVGGNNAPLGKYPWFARLLIQENGLWFWAGCGGSWVARNWVMTAAHCIRP